MTYYDLVKTYGTGKGESAMWKSLEVVSGMVEEMKTSHPDKYWHLIKKTYEAMCSPHFNEEFGMWQICHMFYHDKAGNVHHAPNWTKEQYRQAYELHKSKLNGYTCWDFAVAMEMQLTDYYCLIRAWFPSASEEDMKMRAIEMAVIYLNDVDDEEEGKIWRRFNK